jgi:hypothetical protein
MCLSVAVRLTVVGQRQPRAPLWCRHVGAKAESPRITRSNPLRSLATASRVSAAEATRIPSINSESTAHGCRVRTDKVLAADNLDGIERAVFQHSSA